MFKLRKKSLLIFALAFTLVSQASAEEKWEFTLAPLYLWATGIEGESAIGPVTAPVAIEFEDALDNLDTILTFHFEANKGQHGVLFDTMHMGLVPESVLPNGAPIATDLTNNVIDLAGIYRPNNSSSLELLYGLRYTKYKMDMAIGGVPSRNIANESWTDAFLGLRTMADVGEKGTFLFRGDVGAGGSNLTWSASAIFDYRFNDRFSALAGYRWLDYDFETGSGVNRFTYDVRYQGPVLGAVFYW